MDKMMELVSIHMQSKHSRTSEIVVQTLWLYKQNRCTFHLGPLDV